MVFWGIESTCLAVCGQKKLYIFFSTQQKRRPVVLSKFHGTQSTQLAVSDAAELVMLFNGDSVSVFQNATILRILRVLRCDVTGPAGGAWPLFLCGSCNGIPWTRRRRRRRSWESDSCESSELWDSTNWRGDLLGKLCVHWYACYQGGKLQWWSCTSHRFIMIHQT